MAPTNPPAAPKPPDAAPLDMAGLGTAIDRIATLATRGEAAVLMVGLPEEATPPGLTVEAPGLLVLRHGNGHLEMRPIAPMLEGLLGKPARRKGTAMAGTLESFCDLVNRNGDDHTVIFLKSDWRAPKVTAVLNYSLDARKDADADVQPEARPAGDDPLARFGDHRVEYAFPLSEPWKEWVAKDGKLMPAEDFARWLEDHIAEIAVPDTEPGSPDQLWAQRFRTRLAQPNELIDLARDLSIVVNARIKTKTRLDSGETALVFETEHQDLKGQPVSIPGLFVLSLPIFFRGFPQRLLVRLRYRPAGGDGVMWAFEIHRPDEAVDERVRTDAEEIAHRTGRLVIDGAPEGASGG